MKAPKYQYHVQTWGGFYNKEYKYLHGLEEGDYLFYTAEEREEFVRDLRKIEKELNANFLMVNYTEGFDCDTRTVIHRVVEYQGKQYYSSRDLGVNYPYGAAKYMLECSWTPGFNDEPLGDDYEGYDEGKVVKEWITGAFEPKGVTEE